MSPILSWLATHYVGVGRYVASAVGAVLVALLSTALPQLRLSSRIPARLAIAGGSLVLVLGVLVGAAKLTWPNELRRMSWLGPAITCALGLGLLAAAWGLRKLYRHRWRQRLQPMMEAALRTADRARRAGDHYQYADLRTHSGRLVVEELIAETRRRRPTAATLLVGPAGAGKTEVLLEVAARCRSAWEEGSRLEVIPVYVDLARVGDRLSQMSFRDVLLRELTSDAELSRVLTETWGSPRPDVTWLFMLDNCETLFMDQSQDTWIEGSLNDLRDFLALNPRILRAVLTGRHVPVLEGIVRIGISPLSDRARDHFLTTRGVTPAWQATLKSEKSFRQYLGNPGWLSLVSAYLLQRPGMVVDNFYELMANLISHTLSTKRAAADTQRLDHMRMIAELIALFFMTQTSSDTPIRKSDVTEYLFSHFDDTPGEIGTVLSQLASHGLIRWWSRPSGSGQHIEYIEFMYDAIQDYFAARRLIHDSSPIVIATLLTDARWSTIAISLVQHGPDDLVAQIIATAREILNAYKPQPQAATMVINKLLKSMQLPERSIEQTEGVKPRWPSAVYRVLHILDAGSQRRLTSLIPPDICELADFFIADAVPGATPDEHVQMLDVQNLAHTDVAAAACAVGLRSSSGALVHAALTHAATRHEVVDALALKDQIRLLLAIATIGLDSRVLRDGNTDFAKRLRLASTTGVVTAWLFAIFFGFVALLELASHFHTWNAALFEIGLAVIVAGGLILARKNDWMMRNALARGVQWPYILLILFTGFGCFGLISIILGVLTGNFASLAGVPWAGTLLWPASALYYLAVNTRPEMRNWRFPFIIVVFPAWKSLTSGRSLQTTLPSKRRILEWVLGGVTLAAAVTFVEMRQKNVHFHGMSRGADHRLHVILAWLAGITFAVSIGALPVADMVHDRRVIRRWIPPTTSTPKDVDILGWLDKMRSTRGTIRMLVAVERRLPIVSGSDAAQLLADLCRALGWVQRLNIKGKKPIADHLWATMPQTSTIELVGWLKAYDRRHPGGLATIARRHEHRLADYLLKINDVSVGSESSRSPAKLEKKS
jgi:hypothetical protein